LVVATIALSASPAAAAGIGTGTAELSCTQVTFKFEGFNNVAGNTVTEEVTVNKELVASTTYTFNGPSGSNVVGIPEAPERHIVDAHATWKCDQGTISGGPARRPSNRANRRPSRAATC
jgi:hypothetical protein